MDCADDFYLFVKGGYIAIAQTDADAAEKLFQAAIVLKPQNPLPQVGLGYLYFQIQRFKDAIQRFERVLKQDPTNEMAEALLGLATTFLPRGEEKGKTILRKVRDSTNPTIRKLGDAAFTFIEHSLHKPPGPAGKHV